MITHLLILKEGGLFDFDLTLPLIISEFLVLSFILDKLLYKPILSTIDNRKSYINKLSNEINLLIKKGENLLFKYESIIAKEQANLSKDNLNFNQICDKTFQELLDSVSEWNIKEIKRSKTVITYQVSSLFKSLKRILSTTEEKIYKSIIS